VIDAQLRTTSPLLFPSRINNRRITGWTKLVKQLQHARCGVDFRLHDLRRTCRTLMSRLDVPEDVGELCIGHARDDLIRLYNKDQAWPARVAAFEKISAHISALLTEAADDRGNIIPLRGAGRVQAT
jgi:integrase